MKRSELAVFIGNRIKDERKTKKMSQEALAFESGIHPSYFGCLERGEKCPTVDTLFKISNALGIPVSDLLTSTDQASPSRIKIEKKMENTIKKIPDDKLEEAAKILELLAGLID